MSQLLKHVLEDVTGRAGFKNMGIGFVIGSDPDQLMVHFTISRKGEAFRFYNSKHPEFRGRIYPSNTYVIDGDTGEVIVGNYAVVRVMPDVKTQQGLDLPGWQGMLNPKLAECAIFTVWLRESSVYTAPGRDGLEDFLRVAAGMEPRLVMVTKYQTI